MLVATTFEDGQDALAGGALEFHRQGAGCLEARLAVLPSQGQQPQAGAITLLGVRFAFQKMLDYGTRMRADRGTPVDQSLWSPLGMRTMRMGHMRRASGVNAMLVGAHMCGDTLTTMEHLDGGGAEASPELLPHETMGHAVIVMVDFNVVIVGGSHPLPLCGTYGTAGSGRIAGRSSVSKTERRLPGSFVSVPPWPMAEAFAREARCAGHS
jgi:hypothetical protein